MYKLSKTRIYIILAICLAGIFFAVPNVIGDKTKLPKWWRPVNLGLDLQGGSNLLLQVKVDDVIRERMGQVEDDARQVLRENKIRYQNLKAGADNVKVKIDNLNARNKAISAFRKMNGDLNVQETNDGVIEIRYKEQALNELKLKAVDQSIEIVRRRIDETGTNEPSSQSQGIARIAVQLPGEQNPERIKALLGKPAKLSFHLVDSRASRLRRCRITSPAIPPSCRRPSATPARPPPTRAAAF